MTYALKAKTRTTAGPKTRGAGALPGVVYGAGGKSESIALEPNEFLKIYRTAGEASLIDLTIGDTAAGKVLVQEVQYDPVTDRAIHVDLRRIDMTKPMTATVELKFVGEAPVVKAQGGTLVTTVSAVQVKCLPIDLVAHIDVDLSSLSTYEEVIKVKDLRLPAGITIVSPHPEDLVLKATRALTEEEIKKLEEESAAMDVSKIESVKPVKEEATEGEAAEAKEEKPVKGGVAGGKDEKK